MDTSYYGNTIDTSYGMSSTAGLLGVFAGIGIFIWIISMAASILMIVSTWKIFKKAGQPGWASLIPIYNVYIMCKIAEKEWWYILLLCVPIANLYAIFVIYDGIARKFGKSSGFAIGMMFLPIIFVPILAFGKNEVDTYNTNDTNNLDNADTVNEQSNLNVQNNDNINQNVVYNENQTSSNNFNKVETIGMYDAPVFNDFSNVKQDNLVNSNEINQFQSVNSGQVSQGPVNNEVNSATNAYANPNVTQNVQMENTPNVNSNLNGITGDINQNNNQM